MRRKKWREVKVVKSCPIICDLMNCSLPGSSVRGILQARILEGVAIPGDFPNQGIEPRSPALQVDPLPSELPDKPKNTGVGSLSLLHHIFPTQESNWEFLHCRRILYQLSYQGSPPNGLKSDWGDFPVGTVVKNLPVRTGDIGSISGPERLHMSQSS